MAEDELIGRKARGFFEGLWKRGDFWEIESSEYEQERLERLRVVIDGRHYTRLLEMGCGAGTLTRLLARIADQVVALDISPSAIEQARAAGRGLRTVDFRVANIMEYDLCAEGPWDLVVMSETIYYLGWLYPFFDLAWLAAQIFAATRDGGRFLLANTLGRTEDHLLLPWIVRTYRDLFLNVGYLLEREEVFRGIKNGVHFEVLISLFTRASAETPTDGTRACPQDAIQAITREH